MPKMEFVVLNITTWRGYGDGTHYYGRLTAYTGGKYKSLEIRRTIQTAAEAAALNKKDRASHKFGWKIGHTTNRFDTVEEIEEFAKRIWRAEFPDAHGLVKGCSARADPQEPLDAEPKILKKLRQFWKRAEATGGYERSPKAMGKVSDAYHKWVCGT